MPFEPKDSNINRSGRKPGAKDKVWASLEYWFTELQRSLENPKLQISDKVKAQLKCIELLLAKRNLPNESVEDSVNNAKQLMDELKSLEASIDTQATNKTSLDDGTASL
jgi:hypothetical protein